MKKPLILTAFILTTIILSAQNVNFREGVNREVDTTTKLFYSNKPGSMVRIGMRVGNDTAWLNWNGSTLQIIADTVLVNEILIGQSFWESGTGANAIIQKGISPGGVGSKNYIPVVGKLGITRFLDATSQNPTHIVGYKESDSTTIPIFIQSGILDGDTLKSKVTNGTSQGQLAYWDTTTSKLAYAAVNNLRWKTDSTKLFAQNFVADSVSIGTNNKTESLTVNGRIRLYDDGGSIYIGDQSGIDDLGTYANSNVGIGQYALTNVVAGGRNNTAIGNSALRNISTSDYQTAIGAQALYSCTSGQGNTAAGYRALFRSTSAYYNTAFGKECMSWTSTGGYNVGIGEEAMEDGTSHTGNVGIGFQAMDDNKVGGGNVSIGYRVAGSAEYVKQSVIIGYYAGNQTSALVDCDTLIDAVIIGQQTRPLTEHDTNTIIIGHATNGKGPNSVVLGNDNIDSTFLKGIVHVPVLHTATTLVLSPTASAPTNPENGTIYFSSTDNKLHIYANSAWYSLDLTAD
jgi:hypothetical protein